VASELSFDAFQQTRHYLCLDGLRGLAVCLVLWHHGKPRSGTTLLGRGFLGVELFFVLSGFLIVSLLLRERREQGTISLRRFYARRALRILPPFYGLIGVLAIGHAVARDSVTARQFFDGLPLQLGHLANWSRGDTQGLSMSWSLAAEEQFYLVIPFLLAVVPRRFLVWSLGLLGLVNALLWTPLPRPLLDAVYGERHPFLVFLDATYMSLILGALLACALESRRGFAMVSNLTRLRLFRLGIVPALLAIAALSPLARGGPWRFAFQLLAAWWIAGLVVNPSRIADWFFEHRALRRLGTISYGLYLYHLTVFGLVFKVADRLGVSTRIVTFPIACLVTYVVAAASYRFFETPIARFAARFKQSSPAARVPTVQSTLVHSGLTTTSR
jgi:peptidoglycan/LPS O-acetylase OafA/YrhL